MSDALRLQFMTREHFDAVWRSAKRLGIDAGRAEDIAQKAFIIASEKLQQIEPGKEKAFLMGVVARLSSDARKHAFYARASNQQDALSARFSTGSTPEQVVSREQALQILDQALSQLPDELREIFVLSQVEEMTMADIAQALGIPSGTVASRLRRAREQFRQLLSAWVPSEDRESWMRMVAGDSR